MNQSTTPSASFPIPTPTLPIDIIVPANSPPSVIKHWVYRPGYNFLQKRQPQDQQSPQPDFIKKRKPQRSSPHSSSKIQTARLLSIKRPNSANATFHSIQHVTPPTSSPQSTTTNETMASPSDSSSQSNAQSNHGSNSQSSAQSSLIHYKREKMDFWTTKGMDAFIDWITNRENYQRLVNVSPFPSREVMNIHQEIADHVNGIHNLDWDRNIVAEKLQYAKRRYIDAQNLTRRTKTKNDWSKVNLRNLVLTICPNYDRLKAVYDDSLSNSSSNSPSSKQPISKHPCLNLDDSDMSPGKDNDGNTSDIEDGITENSAKVDHDDQQEREHKQQGQYDHDYQLNLNDCALSKDTQSSDDEPLIRRRRVNEPKTPQHTVSKRMTESSNAVLAEPSTNVVAAELSTRDIEEAMRCLRLREIVVDEREKESYRRIAEKEKDLYWRMSENEKASYQRIGENEKASYQRICDNEKESHRRISENERNHNETLDRRMREFTQEKEEFRQMKDQFNRQKEAFEKEKDALLATREKLLIENAALKRELEIRLR